MVREGSFLKLPPQMQSDALLILGLPGVTPLGEHELNSRLTDQLFGSPFKETEAETRLRQPPVCSRISLAGLPDYRAERSGMISHAAFVGLIIRGCFGATILPLRSEDMVTAGNCSMTEMMRAHLLSSIFPSPHPVSRHARHAAAHRFENGRGKPPATHLAEKITGPDGRAREKHRQGSLQKW
jgi:hypothetical protein